MSTSRLFGLPSLTKAQRTGSEQPSTKHSNGIRACQTNIQTPDRLRIAPWTGSPVQKKALATLTLFLENAPYEFDEDTLKWFLRDRDYEPKEAAEKLLKTARWRQRICLDTLSRESFGREYDSGKIRLHEHRDVLDRPVILLDASKHVIGKFPVESTQKLSAYIVKEALSQLPDGVDTFIAIFDLRRFTMANADLQFIKYMIDLFFVYHPKRLGQCLLVDAPWVFKPVWQVVKPLLRKYSALVRFVNANQVRQEYFTVETLPEEFGL